MSSIRFGVVRPDGIGHSDTYNLTGRAKSREVYLFCRSVGRFLKVSLHPSGKWHIKFDPRGQVSGAPKDGVLEEWDAPDPIADGVRRAFSIVVPRGTLTRTLAEEGESVEWHRIGRDAPGVDFHVFFTDNDVSDAGWPGKRGMGSSLTGSVRLSDGSRVWVVSVDRTEPIALPPINLTRDNEERMRSAFERGADEVRMLLLASDPEGVRVIVETVFLPKAVERPSP